VRSEDRLKRDPEERLYYIGVAARLVDCHPQTLRMYERMGLINPGRSDANVRLYSDADIERLHQIKRLTQEMGINLAGVEVVLNLLDRMERMNEELQVLRRAVSGGTKALGPASPRPQAKRVEVVFARREQEGEEE
jgi:MerR family transcriptional regulator/heat shock protein HspR